MRRGLVAGAAGIALVATIGLVAILSEDSSSDTENCASQGEYDQLESLWSTDHVSELFDVPGWVSFSGDNSFRKSYHTCWDFDGTKIVVAYGIDDGLSFNWWTAPIG
jgi:hypothetical protein